jgi:hypothetical protein
MGLWPIEPLFHVPQIDDIADQIEILALRRVEKIQKIFGAASRETEVDIGDPNGPVGPGRSSVFHRSILKLSSRRSTMPDYCVKAVKDRGQYCCRRPRNLPLTMKLTDHISR